MKKFEGHLYETCKDWHPVVIRNKGTVLDDIIMRPHWLSTHCPDGPADYDAYVYGDDSLMDRNHRSVYFFRDKKVAVLFALTF